MLSQVTVSDGTDFHRALDGDIPWRGVGNESFCPLSSRETAGMIGLVKVAIGGDWGSDDLDDSLEYGL